MPSASHPSSTPGSAPQPLWHGIFGTLGGVALGAVLLIAAWGKILDPESFVDQIRIEGLDALFAAEVVAMIALGLEVGLGLALVLGVRRLWVLVPASLLVVSFLFLTGRTYYLSTRGLLEEVVSCGCFGNLVERTPAQAFWQDLFLLVPPLLLSFVGRGAGRRLFPAVRAALVAVLTGAALVFAYEAPDLPLDDLATRLRPGVEVSDLCTGAGDSRICVSLVVPELEQGRHVVVMAELGEEEGVEELGAAVADLNAYALAGGGPRLWVVSEITPEQLNTLFWQWGPVFEIREAPGSLLRPLYRRLPRSFLVEDGRVVETFPGLPPLAVLSGGPLEATFAAGEGGDST